MSSGLLAPKTNPLQLRIIIPTDPFVRHTHTIIVLDGCDTRRYPSLPLLNSLILEEAATVGLRDVFLAGKGATALQARLNFPDLGSPNGGGPNKNGGQRLGEFVGWPGLDVLGWSSVQEARERLAHRSGAAGPSDDTSTTLPPPSSTTPTTASCRSGTGGDSEEQL
ncbi:hypothetical protein F4802DRAFT_216409 [Xylaria palmicola]|nr:hypothetical protein F4802DRAFT_216409 [Xylaria palmicola]